MNRPDKIAEGQIQLENEENYRPLATPMVEETSARVEKLITALHHNDHIDTWLENGYPEQQIHLVSLNSTLSQRFTKLNQSVDPSYRAAGALKNVYHHL